VCQAAEVCYPPCGCFNDDPPFDDRDLPMSPVDQYLQWFLLTKENPDKAVQIIPPSLPSQFDPNRPTKFLFHGWNANPESMKGFSDAFLKSGGYDYNIIIVDWEWGAGGIWYPLQASNTRVAGACTGAVAKTLVEAGAKMADMHCIGLSLGAHGCGYFGKFVNGSLGRITGLDPAGPWFDTDDTRVRLDKTDAIFQDNIHTNGDTWLSFGMGRPIGHVDFFPNKAGDQPPCGGDIFPGCHHTISASYFIQSIVARDQCTFTANPCNSEADADNGLCESCQEDTDCQRMGYYANTMPGKGTFYLRTVAQKPYCEN